MHSPEYQDVDLPRHTRPSGKSKISQASCKTFEPPETSRAPGTASRALRSLAKLLSGPINRRSSFPFLTATPRSSLEPLAKNIAGYPPVDRFCQPSVGRLSACEKFKSSESCPKPFTWSRQLPARQRRLSQTLFSSPLTLLPSLCLPPPLTVFSIPPSRYSAYSVCLLDLPVLAQSFRTALEATMP